MVFAWKIFIFSLILLVRQKEHLWYFPRILEYFRQGKCFFFCQDLTHAMIFQRPVAHVTSIPSSQEELKGRSLSISQKTKMQVRVTVFYWRLCARMKHRYPNTLQKMQVFIKRCKIMKFSSYKSIILDCRHQQILALLKPRTD